MNRWRVYVDARIEIVVEAETGDAAELVVRDALEDGDVPALRSLDWSDASLVPGSAVPVKDRGRKVDL